GDQRPFSNRPLAHRNFLVPIEIPGHSEILVVLRAETGGTLKLPLDLWSQPAFFEYDQQALTLQLGFAGLMLALAIYNFFLWVSIRDSSYLWYVLSMLGITCTTMAQQGLLAQFAWPEHPGLNNVVLVG